MESVGKTLREARLRLGLTLEQVGAHTRISLKNLSAIEADDLSYISSPFFYRSFVRQFAAAVKLDYDSIEEAVRQAASTMPEPLVPGQADAPMIHVSAIRPKRAWNLRWLRSVVSFSVVLAACSGIYAMWQNSHANWHDLLANIGAQVERVRESVKPSAPLPRAEEPARTAETPTKPDGAATSQRVASAFHIQLAAIERSWLSIVADGKEVFSGTLDAAETKVLEGRESARIRTGNAGGLTFRFNGREIGVLGPRGQVRTVVFTKDDYKVLPSTPEVAFNLFTQNVD